MTAITSRSAFFALLAASLLIAGPALAQIPTAEGTIITNTATASWTDANGNSYAPVQASISVTVGFLPGPDVEPQQFAATPASPSIGNSLPFSITNTGNGIDLFTVSLSVPTGIVVTGLQFNGSTYASLDLLNAVLALLDVNAAQSLSIGIVYDVLPSYGGASLPITMTVASLRDPTGSGTDSSIYTVSPTLSAGVTVTPDGTTVERLPSNGTVYSETFMITNAGNSGDTYVLTALGGAFVSVLSVNGTSGTSGSIALAAGETQSFAVTYTVGSVVAGSSQLLSVTAVSSTTLGVQDIGNLTISVIRPALIMTKVAYRDDQTTAITGSLGVLPQEYVRYLITVTNAGTAPAKTVTISDQLPAQVIFVSALGVGWTISYVGGTVTAVLDSDLAVGASQFIWVRAQVK